MKLTGDDDVFFPIARGLVTYRWAGVKRYHIDDDVIFHDNLKNVFKLSVLATTTRIIRESLEPIKFTCFSKAVVHQ